MKRTTIFLDEALKRDHRRARRPRLSFVGAGAGGRSDVAERHEELLWRDRDPHDDSDRSGNPGRSRRRAAR